MQHFTLNGSERPPWSVSADVADGLGSITATDLNAAGVAIGPPVTQAFESTYMDHTLTSGITVSSLG